MLVVQTVQQFLLTELNLLSPQDISALIRLLSLAEQILSWDFSHYHILLVLSMCLLKSLNNGHLSLNNIKLGRVNTWIALLFYTVLVKIRFYVEQVKKIGTSPWPSSSSLSPCRHRHHCFHCCQYQLRQVAVNLPWWLFDHWWVCSV